VFIIGKGNETPLKPLVATLDNKAVAAP